MIFFVCVLAGAIGASVAGGVWPDRSFSSGVTVAAGMIGGTLAWTIATELAAFQPNVSTFLTILAIGGIGGAMFSMGLASLRNILRAR